MQIEITNKDMSTLSDMLLHFMVEWEIEVDKIKKGEREKSSKLEQIEQAIRLLSRIVPQNRQWATGTSHGEWLYRIKED